MRENKLWYMDPANDWNEALPLGNGKLGMMIFGGINEERIQLNEESFWSGWECGEYDNPQTYEHLEEMRELIFAGKYTEAQKLCDQYLICRSFMASIRQVKLGNPRRNILMLQEKVLNAGCQVVVGIRAGAEHGLSISLPGWRMATRLMKILWLY